MSVSNPYTRNALSVLVALLLAVGTSHAAETEVLTPEAQRITDQKINVDLATLKATQDRIAKLNSNGTGADNYYLVKAQAWLDFAMSEYYENDRSHVIDQALFQAQDLIGRMEQADNNISLDTPVIPESERLREDLWIIAGELKQHRGFVCASAPIAEMEVRLVWAGHENKELGWRHAREHFAAAERLAKQARKLADNCFCPQPAEKPCPLVAVVEPPVQEMLDMTKKRKPFSQPAIIPEAGPEPISLVNVPRNVHFGLDQSTLNEKAVIILGRVTEILQAYPKMTIMLIGHTDSRASKAYNQALSERRAKSVLKFLEGKGIANSRVQLRGEGFNNTLADADENMGHALSRRVEMAYLGENIQSYDQTGDLVMEEVRKAKAAKAARAIKAKSGKSNIGKSPKKAATKAKK
jgi:outer membrane protein OmpA-like peptidoglycan-associated protein